MFDSRNLRNGKRPGRSWRVLPVKCDNKHAMRCINAVVGLQVFSYTRCGLSSEIDVVSS
jgi:hypothetical protein